MFFLLKHRKLKQKTICITTKIEKLIDVAAIAVLIIITAFVAIRSNIAITCFSGIAAITTIVSQKLDDILKRQKPNSLQP